MKSQLYSVPREMNVCGSQILSFKILSDKLLKASTNSFSKKTIVVFLLILQSDLLSGQDIEEYYNFKIQTNIENILMYDDLSVSVDVKSLKTKSRQKKKFLYSAVKGQKMDSIVLQDSNQPRVQNNSIITAEDEIFFCLNPAQDIIKINKKTGKINKQATFRWETDSTFVVGLIKNSFVLSKKSTIKLYNPITKTVEEIFKYETNAEDADKEALKNATPIGIGDIFSFSAGNKILIKTGLIEADATWDCEYFITDILNGKLEKLPSSQFEPLIAEPREKLKILSQYDYQLIDFNVDIRKIYFDIRDLVGYIPYHFTYQLKRENDRIESITYNQDAFVIDNNFKIIGRALERNILIANSVYKSEKKSLLTVYSTTDSLKNCFLDVELSYRLEKIYYALFYNTIIERLQVQNFDKYELSLLKNFIYAKHNYKFDSPFYQAYFNTFAIYNDEKKRKSRLKNIEKLFTDADKINLSLLTSLLK